MKYVLQNNPKSLQRTIYRTMPTMNRLMAGYYREFTTEEDTRAYLNDHVVLWPHITLIVYDDNDVMADALAGEALKWWAEGRNNDPDDPMTQTFKQIQDLLDEHRDNDATETKE